WSVSVGQLVEVAFRTGRSQGIITGLTDRSEVPHLKPILDIITPEPVVTPQQIALAKWMSDQTLASLGSCLWLMVPPGLTKRGDTLYTLIDENAETDEPIAAQVLAMLHERGALRGAQIDRALPKSGWRQTMTPLIREGVVQREPILAAPDV